MIVEQERYYARLTIIALISNPSQEYIGQQMQYDRARNPHNEPYHNKPKIRSEMEIIVDYKIEMFKTIEARFKA